MRAVIVSSSTNNVVDIAQVDQGSGWQSPSGTWWVSNDTAQMGWHWNGSSFIAPVIPSPVPEAITPRQFFIQSAISGYITQDEALAAATTGVVPPEILTILQASLSPPQLFAAQVSWARMTLILRDDPLTSIIAQGLGITSAQMDAFFVAASQI